MPADALLELNPPLTHAWWWWLVVAALALTALGLAALGIWRWRALRTTPPRADDALALLRADALRRIDELAATDLPGPERARRIGQAARTFVGTVGDGDADYQSADQLRLEALKDPRLGPASALADRVDAYAFGGTDDDADAIAAAAREVVSRWR
ncbi:MAG: hypothetical protein QM713_04740 [Arachnia sp.]